MGAGYGQLGAAPKTDIIIDYDDRPGRDLGWACNFKPFELDSIGPNLSQEVAKNTDVECLAGAAPVSEAERRVTRMIANRSAGTSRRSLVSRKQAQSQAYGRACPEAGQDEPGSPLQPPVWTV